MNRFSQNMTTTRTIQLLISKNLDHFVYILTENVPPLQFSQSALSEEEPVLHVMSPSNQTQPPPSLSTSIQETPIAKVTTTAVYTVSGSSRERDKKKAKRGMYNSIGASDCCTYVS